MLSLQRQKDSGSWALELNGMKQNTPTERLAQPTQRRGSHGAGIHGVVVSTSESSKNRVRPVT